jgi:hypothetical protein
MSCRRFELAAQLGRAELGSTSRATTVWLWCATDSALGDSACSAAVVRSAATRGWMAGIAIHEARTSVASIANVAGEAASACRTAATGSAAFGGRQPATARRMAGIAIHEARTGVASVANITRDAATRRSARVCASAPIRARSSAPIRARSSAPIRARSSSRVAGTSFGRARTKRHRVEAHADPNDPRPTRPCHGRPLSTPRLHHRSRVALGGRPRKTTQNGGLSFLLIVSCSYNQASSKPPRTNPYGNLGNRKRRALRS